MPWGGAQQVAVDSQQHIHFGEPGKRLEGLAERKFGARANVVTGDWIRLIPTGPGIVCQQGIELG